MPASEIAVGRRLREAREDLMIPRTRFALKGGVTVSRLDTYENGRAILPWSIGIALCKTYQINPLWLFDGLGDKRHYWALSDQLIGPTTPRHSFSYIIHRLLLKEPGLLVHGQLEKPGQPHAAVFAPLYAWLERLPPEKTEEFVAKITAAGDKLGARYLKKRRKR